MFTQIFDSHMKNTIKKSFITSIIYLKHESNTLTQKYHSEKILYCLKEDDKTCSPKKCINHNLKTLNVLQLVSPLNTTTTFKKYGIINIRPFVSTNYDFLKKNKVTDIDEGIYNSIDWNTIDRTIAILTYYNELSEKKINSDEYSDEEKKIFDEYYKAIMERIIHSKSNTVFGLTNGCPCCMSKKHNK